MSYMDNPEEVLDLVDRRDQVTATIVREDIVKLRNGSMSGFVRAAACFVMNKEGQVWIPKRRADKKIAPNGLDFSAAEHVGGGETYIAAAVRGLKEELGLEITEDQLEYVGKTGPLAGLPYFHDIFIFHAESVPHFSSQDFVSYDWLQPTELQSRLQAGVPAKELLLPAVDLLITYLGREQANGH
jgi:isopentenyldiphosphate isomerase